MDFKMKQSLGHAFVNAVDSEAALRFFRFFHGFKAWPMTSLKKCHVCWSSQQGLDYNVRVYRNLKFMGQESVPEAWKPALFSQGSQVPFPRPTKRFLNQHRDAGAAA